MELNLQDRVGLAYSVPWQQACGNNRNNVKHLTNMLINTIQWEKNMSSNVSVIS